MSKERKGDRHKRRPFQLRLHDLLRVGLEELAERNASDVTGEINLAIRKHLTDSGLWPIPPDVLQRHSDRI